MLAHIARTLLIGAVAALAAAPTAQLLRVQGAEDGGRPAALVAQVTPSPEPTPTATATATATPAPTASATPSATPTAVPTASPTPTMKPTPTAKPSVQPTAKPTAPSAAKDPLWEKVVWACLADTSADGESCFRALAATGTSLADLETKVRGRLDELARRQAARVEPTPKPQPTAKPASEFQTWLQLCIASKELYGQECYRAWELSGLASEDFDRKLKSIWGSGR